MRAAAALVAFFAAGAAAAGPLELPGNYGTPAGCRYLVEYDYGDDSAMSLTSEGIEAFATGCEFLSALPARDGSSVVTALCSHEGEEYRTIDMLRVARAHERDAYDIFHSNGDLWATLPSCEARQ